MFYQGSLQEGIALAVSQVKAVVCFVRDDGQLSTTWENEYFADDDEFARILGAKSITLRLTEGSQEAGFLASFCPITKLPAVVVIKNGMLREYIVPDISKEDFRSRLKAAFDDSKPANQVDAPQASQTGAGENVAAGATASAPQPATSTPPAPSRSQPEAKKPASNETQAHREETRVFDNVREPKKTPKQEKPSQSVSQTTPKQKEEERKTSQPKQHEKSKAVQERKGTPTVSASHNKKTDDAEPHPKPKPGPPTQYRLQVRLFDGSSIRSSFSPSQTISRDVRPWINQQTVESHPYNLKHILTPLPNRTLTIVDEEQTLQELNLGATANLVMVPIQSYSEAYAGLGPSIPVRAASTAYDIASNAVGTATGFIGSWLGYGQTTPATVATAGSSTEPAGRGQAAGRPAASQNSNIRTLADQHREQGDSQLYNGNQLNFEPRGNQDQR